MLMYEINMTDIKETKTQNPLLRKAHEEIVRCQVERFRNSYRQYFEREDTEKLVAFFFERIYDLEAQDTIIHSAINTYSKVKNHLSEHTRDNLDNLIVLNQLTHVLDKRMSKLLLKHGWKEGDKLSQEEYFKLFTELGLEAERREQLASSIKCMLVSYHIAHRPFNDTLLKAAKGFAIVFGVSSLYNFIEEGYIATRMVKTDVFDKFIETVTETEMGYLERAFGG